MSQKLLLTCDICQKPIEQRKATNLRTKDPMGDPAEIGGVKGVEYQGDKYTLVEFDLCEDHWIKTREFIKSLRKE